jgi:hypothetical protein
MNKSACLLLLGSVLSINAPAFAENRAVNINIGSTGGSLDAAALRTVRQVIGHAVANGTVDGFIVYGSRTGSPTFIEGGLSGCAEAGITVKKARFNAFIRELRSIHPESGTFYHVEPTENCIREENVVCTQDAKLCPDGSGVGRVPPSCEFARCPGE